jgi:hypothetical protein
LSWRVSLRRTDFVPTVSIIIRHPIRCVVGIGCGGGGIRGVCSRRWSSLGVDGDVLVRLILIVGVTEDNDFAIAGRPEDVAVEVTEELPGELLIPWGISDGIFLAWRWSQIHNWDRLRRTALLA